MSPRDRLPWEIVETLPHTDGDLIAKWQTRLALAHDPADRVNALVGRALASYWSYPLGLAGDSWGEAAAGRLADVDEALALARGAGDPELLAVALLGRLYACWGPPSVAERRTVLEELQGLSSELTNPELRLRIIEWEVLHHFDEGDLERARRSIDTFVVQARGVESKLFVRREVLWRANLEMLEGFIDESVRLNEEAIAETADLAGSPFSFQNVAITVAISLFLRRGLADLIGAIRSIRASSPRVASNWDVGLAFALSEVGELDEARELFEQLAADDFAAIHRDLNWLVSMQLLGLIAVTLDDRSRAAQILELLRPFAGLDGTHGSGYASYGPVGRVVGKLATCLGDSAEAQRWLDAVLASRARGPWTTLARFDRAMARSEHDPTGALADAETAEREMVGFGLEVRAAEAHGFATELRLAGHGRPIARLAAGEWTLAHSSGTCVIGDGVGVRHLVRLLAAPGDAFDVLDLDTDVDPTVSRSTVVEATIDPEARRAYRQRLDDLDESSEADRAEREFLVRELAGGAFHSASSPEIERARLRVTRAIRRSIAAVAGQAPGLAGHLDSTIVTGRRCAYQPADGSAWRVER